MTANAKGAALIEECKRHLLRTMAALPECKPETGTGAGNRAIESAAGFSLELPGQDQWFTWSLLMSLLEEGRVEVVPGTEGRRRFRLPKDSHRLPEQ